MLLEVGLLGDGINILGAVWHHTSIVGQTVDTRVVGDSVVVALSGRLLTRDQLQHHQQEEVIHPGVDKEQSGEKVIIVGCLSMRLLEYNAEIS